MIQQSPKTLTRVLMNFSFSLALILTANNTEAASLKDVDCLATVIYNEARSEPYMSQLAVAKVVQTRASIKNVSICNVILEHGQFSGMTKNKIKMLSLENSDEFIASKQIALLSFDTRIDPSKGATFFQTKSVKHSRDYIVVAVHGNHKFLKEKQ
jgi:spore germination cell wall hydrolase CwlJ-like protein